MIDSPLSFSELCPETSSGLKAAARAKSGRAESGIKFGASPGEEAHVGERSLRRHGSEHAFEV